MIFHSAIRATETCRAAIRNNLVLAPSVLLHRPGVTADSQPTLFVSRVILEITVKMTVKLNFDILVQSLGENAATWRTGKVANCP